MPAVTIGDAVRVSDSVDTKAVLQADSTTQYFLPPRMTTAQKAAIDSPAEGAVVFDTDNNQLEEYTGATWQAAGGGAAGGGAPTDATYIVQTTNGSLSNEQALSALATGIVTVTTATGVLASVAAPAGAIVGTSDSQTLANKILSQLQLILGGFKAIFTHSNSADRTYTLPDYDGTIATVAGTETLTNKNLTDASNSFAVTAAEIVSGTLLHERGGLEADVSAYAGVPLISGGTTSQIKYNHAAATAPTANEDSGDGYVVGSRWIDTTNDKEYVCLDNTLTAAVWTETTGAGSGGLYSSVAILRDEKTSGTAGGASSATTWNNRNLNTESYDPDNIVSIASNQFTPIAGDYIINVWAASISTGQSRLRLYNVTGAASVEEGLNVRAHTADATSATATLTAKFTANGTDAYRIDHYTTAALAGSGLGLNVTDGSPEVYMEIQLTKVA
jgi:hypothetical protein